MNGLGLGAFDYPSGATGWRNVTLKVNPKGDTIEANIAVANVGDGAYDSQVIIELIEEAKDQVQPLLAWNNKQGGMNLYYKVEDGPLAEKTTINVYWAKGAKYADLIGAPIFSYEVPPIFSYEVPKNTAEGTYGPFQIPGNTLSNDPAGVTHLIAASSETRIDALADVKVGYDSAHANPTHVRPVMIDVIKDGLRAAGQSQATIKRTAVKAKDQARAMYENLIMDRDGNGVLTAQEITKNINIQHNGDGKFLGYKAPGDAVINVFEKKISGLTPQQIIANKATIQTAMLDEIVKQGPKNVSKHCAEPEEFCVVDVGVSAFQTGNGPLFVSSVAGINPATGKKKLSYYLDESSSNKCYHLEIKAPF
jgi:hypothetical protein